MAALTGDEAVIDWEHVSRTDIYRQRVFGNRAGKDSFVEVDDHRKMGWASFLLYVLFCAASLNYIWPRTGVRAGALVGLTIADALEAATYDPEPRPQVWEDIRQGDDMRSWLSSALPSFIAPTVQGFNFPIGEVRFTLRRADEVPNTDPRFKTLTPQVWKDKHSVEPLDQSSELDDKTTFGAYRVWASRAGAGLGWCSAKRSICDAVGSKKLGEFAIKGSTREAVIGRCKRECESMRSQPCRCFTLTVEWRCEFYSMPDSQLEVPTTETSGGCPLDALKPELVGGRRYSEAFWPLMKRFVFQEEGNGWRDTPGFVSTLKFWSQDELERMAQETGDLPTTQAKMLQFQIEDWIAGGWLSRGTASLVVDFITHNPNYQVYTWCQLFFSVEASGTVVPSYTFSSLRITHEDIQARNADFWSQLDGWGVIYLVLLAVFTSIELFEIERRGSMYLHSAWNIVTVAAILMHITVLATHGMYMSKIAFTQMLAEVKDRPFSNGFDAFHEQQMAYLTFLEASAIAVFFVLIKLLHHIRDIFPRVEVLTDTVYLAIFPIAHLVFIVIMVFCGFATWGFLMFGKSVEEFHTIRRSFASCTELLFGEADLYDSLVERYPFSGAIFIMVHILLFFFIFRSVAKAIVLTSYSDAWDAKMNAPTMAMKDLSVHGTALLKKLPGVAALRRLGDWWRSTAPMKVDRPANRYHNSPISVFFFTLYLILYVVMAYLMLQSAWAFDLTSSITKAVKSPVFDRVDEISGREIRGNNLASVSTREDVNLFLETSLTAMMFNSSDQGTFQGQPNPLKTYASALPERFTQLVVHDWNILVGQNPVRITSRYTKMERAGDQALSTIVAKDDLLPSRKPGPTEPHAAGTAFDPPLVEAKTFDEILDPQARSVLQKYCTYKFAYASESRTEDPNGFSCMLSVDYAQAQTMLREMSLSNFVNNQSAILVVDFVTYNALIEEFVYAAVVFQFQPSGAVNTEVESFAMRLDLYGSQYWYRIICEILVFLFSLSYIGNTLARVFLAARHQYTIQKAKQREDEQRNKTKRERLAFPAIVATLRAGVGWLLADHFHLLDFTHSILTVALLGVWYGVVFSKLSQDYFFAERPIWDRERCASSEWCGDDEVLFSFYQQGVKLRAFGRFCAFNVVCIFFRALGPLQTFPRVRQVLLTLKRASVDLFWFFFCVFILIMGFVVLGHTIFAGTMESFSTVGRSVITCARLFVGMTSPGKLWTGDHGWVAVFTTAFMVLARYLAYNMAFAIVNRRFREQEAIFDEGFKNAAVSEGAMFVRGGLWVKQAFRRKRGSSEDSTGAGAGESASRLIEDIGAERLALEKETKLREKLAQMEEFEAQQRKQLADAAVAPPSHGSPHHSSPHGSQRTTPRTTPRNAVRKAPLDTDGMDWKELFKPENVTDQTWQSLPPEVQQWCLATGASVCETVRPFAEAVKLNRLNHKVTARGRLPFIKGASREGSVDPLKQAEDALKAQIEERLKEAEEAEKDLNESVLPNLKGIHQDQESLAWYIMQREGALAKLEKQRDGLRKKAEQDSRQIEDQPPPVSPHGIRIADPSSPTAQEVVREATA